jgi:mono/diheme cytochrome c family protein
VTADRTLVSKGRAVYTNYCAGCHLATGKNPPVVPALAGNEALSDLAHVVRSLREGRGVMPAFTRLERRGSPRLRHTCGVRGATLSALWKSRR